MALKEDEAPGFLKNDRPRINDLSRERGFGRMFGTMTDLYRGIDHRHAGTAAQKNTDHQGLVLFTRPQLNLSYNNVVADRSLTPLLDENPRSMWRALRAMLDPKGNYASDLFDNRQAFITVMSNTLDTLSGFPDVTVNTYTSTEGMRKEAYSIVDDVAEINGTYDITANFANVEGDPISMLLHAWVRYAGYVYSGEMVPYPEFVAENRVDYQTRIWRIILDVNKRFVKRIVCANAAFPMASPMGAGSNYDRSQPYIQDNEQISMPFRCMGAEYNDPILYHEFNDTVQFFNPGMRDDRRGATYIKLKPSQQNEFGFWGYPRINLETLELEWWVSKQDSALINS